MSVDGEEVLLSQHYGSMYTMSDYTAEVHNLNLNLSFLPSPQVRVYGMINYNLSTGELEEVVMPDISEYLDGALSHQDFTFVEMNTYSDLDYQWLRANFGLEYSVSPTVTLTAEADYLDLTDNAGGWVYGDESGSQFLIRTGVRIDF